MNLNLNLFVCGLILAAYLAGWIQPAPEAPAREPEPPSPRCTCGAEW